MRKIFLKCFHFYFGVANTLKNEQSIYFNFIIKLFLISAQDTTPTAFATA
ncbi:hypothetical protein SAMN05421780_103179 [Flexibacter flexilis DSM 6793]|uniref:Uncharacterized protein n=1 Tax=Flexibacter flexilis DSM 6793 TaxID=927664 RepID=A0A1I1H2R3_9BACT|nr:hypothetical protein SAMN05421780_103179 [Flexibacter flexilis DSM 6793]